MKRAIKEAMQLLGECSKATRLDFDAAKQTLKKTQQVIANVVGAIKAGAFSAALKTELACAEAERERLQAVLDIDHDETVNVATFLRQAVSRHKVLMADIASVAMRDAARARAHLRTLVGGHVPLRPNPTREFLIAELSGHYAGLVTLSPRKISVDLR